MKQLRQFLKMIKRKRWNTLRTTWFDGALSESGNIQLNGLKSISLKTAECLGQLRAGSAEGISLNGLESLTDQSAEEILKYQGYFQIKGPRKLVMMG